LPSFPSSNTATSSRAGSVPSNGETSHPSSYFRVVCSRMLHGCMWKWNICYCHAIGSRMMPVHDLFQQNRAVKLKIQLLFWPKYTFTLLGVHAQYF
jgi:hypothetical protein